MAKFARKSVDGVTPVIETLFNAQTTNGTSDSYVFQKGRRTAQASIAGTGAVSATVGLYGTNVEGVPGLLLVTFALSGTNSDSATSPSPGDEIPEYPIHYFVLSGITGTGASVTATLAV